MIGVVVEYLGIVGNFFKLFVCVVFKRNWRATVDPKCLAEVRPIIGNNADDTRGKVEVRDDVV